MWYLKAANFYGKIGYRILTQNGVFIAFGVPVKIIILEKYAGKHISNITLAFPFFSKEVTASYSLADEINQS